MSLKNFPILCGSVSEFLRAVIAFHRGLKWNLQINSVVVFPTNSKWVWICMKDKSISTSVDKIKCGRITGQFCRPCYAILLYNFKRRECFVCGEFGKGWRWETFGIWNFFPCSYVFFFRKSTGHFVKIKK